MSTPSAPIISYAPRSSEQRLEYQWSAPIDEGSSAITGYRLTLDDGTTPIVNTYGAGARYASVTGLTNGSLYTAIIEATNDSGSSYGTAASFRPFEPGNGVPGEPASVGAVAGPGYTSAIVEWTAPSSLPDSTIFWYVIKSQSSDPADPVIKRTANGLTQTSLNITGLNPSSTYTFTIQAVDCPGYGPAVVTNSVGITVPDAPTNARALPGNAQATVSFTAPTNDGGSAITSYTVTSTPDGITATGSSSPITITGLTNETSYIFYVFATNSIGNSASGAPSSSVIPTSSPRLLYSDGSNTEVIGYAGTIPVGTLVIPEGVTSIASSAFYERSDLITISLPSTLLTIGISAFARCGLTSVTIPGSLTSFGPSAFSECLSLTTLTIGEGVTNIDGAALFSGCTQLNSISFPSTLLTIGTATFASCGLTSIIIPEGVTTIGFYTFSGNTNLTNATFPITNTITINAGAFEGTALTSVTLKTGSTVDSGAFPAGCTINYV